MKELQFTFYDIISVLMPAVLLLAILYYQTGLIDSTLLSHIMHNIWNIQGDPTQASGVATGSTSNGSSYVSLPDLADFTLAFVVAYVLGHSMNIITRFIQTTPILKQILLFDLGEVFKLFTRSSKSSTSSNVKTFCSRTFPFSVKAEIADQILAKLHVTYGVAFTLEDELVDYLVPFLTPQGAAKRDIFTATACMMRNTAVLGLGFALFFLGDMVRSFANPTAFSNGHFENDLFFLFTSIFAFLIFRSGFQQYERNAEKLLFTGFLASAAAVLPVVPILSNDHSQKAVHTQADTQAPTQVFTQPADMQTNLPG